MINPLPDLNNSLKEFNKSIVTTSTSLIELNKNFANLKQNTKNQTNNFRDLLSISSDVAGIFGFLKIHYKNIGEVAKKTVSFIADFGKALKDKVLDAVNKTKEVFAIGIGHAKSFTRGLKENIVSGFDKIKTVALGAKDGIMNTLSNAGKGIRSFGGRVAGLAKNLGGMIKSLNLGQRAMALFNLVTSLNPIGLIIIAIVALIAVVIYFWDEIKSLAAKFLEWFMSFNIIGIIVNAIAEIFPGFKEGLEKVWTWVKETFTKIADFVKNLWKNIKSWFGFGDDEEATIEVSKSSTNEITGEATDANGNPIESTDHSKAGLGAGAMLNLFGLGKKQETENNQTATPETISQPSQSSGSAQTNSVSIRIENLVKNLNLNVTNMQEGSAKIRDEVNRALIAAIRDTEIAIG